MVISICICSLSEGDAAAMGDPETEISPLTGSFMLRDRRTAWQLMLVLSYKTVKMLRLGKKKHNIIHGRRVQFFS